ncbi:hypothetical protein OnM2_022125 [Erysiphe neolycopersici]|uniref:Uncharacterized protein n=1 Tax=Erysiphe neolycopersici TaxID=212602 RepID=A0A420I2R9_9PEZI|nr:hypothetical protein OnM2_022125 [Erysiphe neolycopersici]
MILHWRPKIIEDIRPALSEVRNDIKVIKDSSINTPPILPTTKVTQPENNDCNSNKSSLEGRVGETSVIDTSKKSKRNTPTDSKEQTDTKQKLRTGAKKESAKSKREAEKLKLLNHPNLDSPRGLPRGQSKSEEQLEKQNVSREALSPKAIPIALDNSPSKFDKILNQGPREKPMVKTPDSQMKSHLKISDQTKINEVAYDKPPNINPNSKRPFMVQYSTAFIL